MRLQTALALAALLAGTGLGYAQETGTTTTTTMQATPSGAAATPQGMPPALATAMPASCAPCDGGMNGGMMPCDAGDRGCSFRVSAEYLLWRLGTTLDSDGTVNLPPFRSVVPYVFRARDVQITATDEIPPSFATTLRVYDVYGLVHVRPTLFAGGNLDGDDRNGFRITAAWNCSRDVCVEANFWMLEQRSADFFATATGSVRFNFGNTSLQNQPAGEDGLRPPPEAIPTTYNATFTEQIFGRGESKMWGSELNLRGRCCTIGCTRIEALAGVRFIHFEEKQQLIQDLSVQELTYVGSTDDEGTFVPSVINFTTLTDSLQARNQFYGFQVGISGETSCYGFFVNGTAKVAVGGMRQEFSYSENVFTSSELATSNLPTMPTNIYPYPTSFSERRVRLDWVPELFGSVGYECSDHCRFWVGYDILILNRVIRPLGGGQNADGDGTITDLGHRTAAPGPALSHFVEQRFVAHGLTFGAEFRY